MTDEAVEQNARVVQQTGEDAATLLKNDGGALPLKASDLSSLAMIGPGAGQTMATGGGGEKATGRAERWIGTADALKRASRGANVTHAVADDMTGTPIPASALSHDGQPGLVRTTTGAPRHAGRLPDRLQHRSERRAPAGSAHTWTGTVTAPKSGSYWINFGELGSWRRSRRASTAPAADCAARPPARSANAPARPSKRRISETNSDAEQRHVRLRANQTRVRAHILPCMLAYHVSFELHARLTPLLFCDQTPLAPTDPVAPATRSPAARANAASAQTPDGHAAHSLPDLLAELGTLCRTTLRIGHAEHTFTRLTTPTTLQARALELLGVTLHT